MVAATLVLSLVLAACAAPTSGAEQAALGSEEAGGSGWFGADAHGYWVLRGAESGDGGEDDLSRGLEILGDGVESGSWVVTLEVTGAGFSGQSTCNHYGSVSVDGEVMESADDGFPTVAQTLMACEDDAMAAEGAFMKVLEGTERYTVTGDRNELVLEGSGGRLRFIRTEVDLERGDGAPSDGDTPVVSDPGLIEGGGQAPDLGDRAPGPGGKDGDPGVGGGATGEEGPSPEEVREALVAWVEVARADLVRRGARAELVVVVSVALETWSDSSVGCPDPGAGYLQVITEGYRIVLGDGEREYSYHGAAGQEPFLCER